MNGYKLINESMQQANQLILVTGMSGSGKTTISHKLSKKLGYKIIHIDDYARDLLRKKYGSMRTFEIEAKIGVKNLIKLINDYQFKSFQMLTKHYNHTKTIIEGTIIMNDKCQTFLDDNPDVKIYLIKLESEQELHNRRLKRHQLKKERNNEPPFTEKELEQKRQSSKKLYNTKKKDYIRFYKTNKDRIILVDNK
jgi:dephospho-CoA kinase